MTLMMTLLPPMMITMIRSRRMRREQEETKTKEKEPKKPKHTVVTVCVFKKLDFPFMDTEVWV